MSQGIAKRTAKGFSAEVKKYACVKRNMVTWKERSIGIESDVAGVDVEAGCALNKLLRSSGNG